MRILEIRGHMGAYGNVVLIGAPSERCSSVYRSGMQRQLGASHETIYADCRAGGALGRHGANGMADATDAASFPTRPRSSTVLPSTIAANASATGRPIWRLVRVISRLSSHPANASLVMLLSLTSRPVLPESERVVLADFHPRKDQVTPVIEVVQPLN